MEQFRQQLERPGQRGHPKRPRGRLTIFFGYAPGAGKTATMLKAAHTAQSRGIDVVVGNVWPQNFPETAALLEGMEVLPGLATGQNQGHMEEFDLDGALKRTPGLIVIDDLAHTNDKGCRHMRRYQDVLELLNAGIDVYTTVSVQNIESLSDTVASITGRMVPERIPDSVLDEADRVELVDVEPEALLKESQPEHKQTFPVETLNALRELALHRCADRANHGREPGGGKSGGCYTDEHILVCLSSSPSNAKIIRTAARMAKAFRGTFTALFVETTDFSAMAREDKQRLRDNMRLAQQMGANIETVYGDDIPHQISEFTRLSGITKIVIGRSAVTRRHTFSKPTLTEQLIANVPNLDVHIIPDQVTDTQWYSPKRKRRGAVVSVMDVLKCALILLIASCIGEVFQQLEFAEANIITIYVLGVLTISIVTTQRIYSLVASVLSALLFNFFFTEPKFSLVAYEQGYLVTFFVMFAAAFITGTLAVKLKGSAKQAARAAYRTKVLFETNQILQEATNKDEIVSATANQLIKLLSRDIVVYFAEQDGLQEPMVFPVDKANHRKDCITQEERAVAMWAFQNNKHAGATTQTFPGAKCLYLAIRVNDAVYGVVGIAVGEQHMDAFESSILLSILGECALALENDKNAHEKEEATILARNEQTRANLLRSISHDLRTPLTSISGNASNLLSNGASFDDETRKVLYQDIYDDSMWLINLVENLLSVTRLDEGQINLRISAELVDEVIAEALRHVNRLRTEHKILVDMQDEFLLAKMDARLIMQVLINLVNNAIKYTPEGSTIQVSARKEGSWAVISVSDDGPGIPDESKKDIFNMFYTGNNRIADSRRSLGLGLSLCRSIVSAHGGSICVSDREPHGAVFTFTLPAEEVQLNESL